MNPEPKHLKTKPKAPGKAGMRLGTEDRKKVYSMLVLFGFAVLLLIRMLFSSEPSIAVAAASPSSPASVQNQRSIPFDQLVLRTDLLKISEESVYTGSGRNIFAEERAVEAAIPTPVASPIVPAPVPVQAPPPISIPPIPLKFFGFGNERGESKSVFLTSAENVFIAREGEIVDRRYKVLHVSATQVEVEDILTAHRETLALSHE